MRNLFFVVALIAGGWYYFIGGRTLDEAKVRTFYTQQEHALLSRDPEALCAQMASHFQGSAVSIVAGQRTTVSINRDQACESYREMFRNFEILGDKMGGILQLDYDFKIKQVAISDNHKSATVKTKYNLDVAGSLMTMRGTSDDTLIRRNGKVLLERSEGTQFVLTGGSGT